MAAEERKDMRSEYVVAAVSVLIALLGIAGTLLVTAREEQGEAERAHQEFVRGQRREAYAELLSSIVDHEEERDRFVDSVVDLTEPPAPGDLDAGYADYVVAYDKLVLALHTVKMMGSDELLATLDDVQASHDDVHDGIGAAMELTREGDGAQLLDSTVRHTMRTGFQEELRDLPGAMDRFTRLARADLGLAT
jgi:hypothetical protein